MAEKRLRQVAGEFNLGISSIVDFLAKKGMIIDSSPNTKLTSDAYELLSKEFAASKSEKQASANLAMADKIKKNVVINAPNIRAIDEEDDFEPTQETAIKAPENVVAKIETPKPIITSKEDAEKIITKPKVLGKIDLSEKKKPKTTEAKKPAVIETVKTESVKPEEKITLKPLETTIKKTEKIEEKTETISPKLEQETITPVEEVEEKIGITLLGMLPDEMLNATNRPAKKPHKKKPKHKEIEAIDEEAAEIIRLEEIRLNKIKESREAEDAKVHAKKHDIEKIQSEDAPILDFLATKFETLSGPKVLGKMELPVVNKPGKKKPVGSSSDNINSKRKRKRKRIQKEQAVPKVQTPAPTTHAATPATNNSKLKKKKLPVKAQATEEDIQKQIKETLARLSDKKKSTSVKHRRQKRDRVSAVHQEEVEKFIQDQKILKVTEFVSANDLANMMDVSVNNVISTCMSLGLFVSINQRLDAETLSIVAEEFGFKLSFVDAEVLNEDNFDSEENIQPDSSPRPPIVTIMGHVDHGKTSLLDYIRNANVIAGEAGGITQHIGAYEVELENNKKITFLDTPGHEAFTAMRARGSKVTDIAVIVIAADDSIMPQTKEAINHAQAAGVPIIFAINKIDKPGANPERIKEQLANMNLLVEDWGGKIQSQDISAKKGTNVTELMDKILLEAEMLELKCNEERKAIGTVLEAFLDKGKGYVANVLVQNGTMNIGDIILVGTTWGKIKAMYNERNKRIEFAGPAQPALILGLNTAPLAGDTFKVMKDEHEAKNIANKREQLQRQQNVHAKKHITLDEIGRRLAIGDFKELNIIVKGDVDGSVEALSDSLEKLGTEEVQLNIIHKSVGGINEADVILASASDAIIIGFQVRPSLAARKLAEKEQTDIRLYSVIYKAIDEIKSAMQGMLSPEIVEEIVCNIEVRDVFNITKVGTIAGCYVLDGKINRNDKVRIIRDGIVIHTGLLGSLKRFKDDAKDVAKGFECGLNIQNFNNINVGDIIEGYREVEVERQL